MEISGIISGIKFTYLNYYLSNSSEATQFVVYTGSNLVKKYQAEIDIF